MYDIVALGESLIDFTPAGWNELGMPCFSQNPGGAPANVLAMASKLGLKTAFIGKVGADSFGSFLRKSMEDAGICCEGLRVDERVPTTLAFVHLDERGDRSFTFYRNPGADLMLRAEEVDEGLLTQCRIFHFGSVSLTGEPSRSATLLSAKRAKEAGALISYDPNYRPFLWDSEEQAKETILGAIPLVDVLKVSDGELSFLTGEQEIGVGIEKLLRLGPMAVLVTRGEKGVCFATPDRKGEIPAYRVSAIDTTGAGDAFWGALLSGLPGKRAALAEMSLDEWTRICRFANAAGGLTTTQKGAIPAMPSPGELWKLIELSDKTS